MGAQKTGVCGSGPRRDAATSGALACNPNIGRLNPKAPSSPER